MKHILFVLAFLFIVSDCLADTGQVRVFRFRRWRHRPVPVQPVPVLPTPPSVVPTNSPLPPAPVKREQNSQIIAFHPPTTNVPAPNPFEIEDEDDLSRSEEGRGGFFEEEFQQAVIAWNGKEEILLLTTQQQYDEKESGAVVSFLPLNGKPKDIYKGNPHTFSKLVKTIETLADTQKPGWRNEYREGGRSGDFKVLFNADIGAHHISAIEVLDNDTEAFYKKLQEYITSQFGENTAAQLGEQEKKVFEHYIKDLHFKYFAVDIQKIESGKKKKEKEAIAYRFESKQLYFPLYISKLGGKGETQVQLAVITPDKKLKLKGYNTPIEYTPTVKMTETDIKKADEKIGKLMSDADTSAYRAFVWLLEEDIDKFEKDFIIE